MCLKDDTFSNPWVLVIILNFDVGCFLNTTVKFCQKNEGIEFEVKNFSDQYLPS